MENITENKRKRLERNLKIKNKYESEMAKDGSMSSKVVSNLAKSFKVSIPTVYSAINCS